MKQKHINNALHIVVMFGILYLIGNHNVAGFQTWPLHEKIWGVGILGFIFGAVIGIIPERLQALFKVGSFSLWDLIWYGIGGALGSWASVAFPNVLFYLAWLCILLYVGVASYQISTRE